eukprot:symbB.v1.2.027329.t1/scaffold2762.1/size141425/6
METTQGENFLLPASTLTPSLHPLRSSLGIRISQKAAAAEREGSVLKLPKSGSTFLETSPTSGRASEATVAALSNSFDSETKVEWLQQELDKCEAQRCFAAESQKDLEGRLERQRITYEKERQSWQNDRLLLERQVAQLEMEKRQLLQSLEALARTLPPTASHAAPHVVRFLSVSHADENPCSPRSDASSVAQVLCGSGGSEG